MLDTLVVIAIVAALAPIVVDLPARIRLPVVVVEVLLGILVGPDVLGFAKQGTIIDFLSTLGLAFLFFLAGVEIEFERVRGRPARLGAVGWLVSIALGLSIGALLEAVGFVLDWELIGFALCTTALGTLMPILRDEGELESRFGSYVVGIGTSGEFGPIVAVSLFFGAHRTAASAVLLVVFAVIAVAAALVAMRARPRRITRLIAETMQTSAHLAVRLSLLVLIV
ncbi:MAG: cation:proton antiporter, partial [Actinomycetota bacterium]|nr:cation:proton antiporter [Actinomycetota bacterium]